MVQLFFVRCRELASGVVGGSHVEYEIKATQNVKTKVAESLPRSYWFLVRNKVINPLYYRERCAVGPGFCSIVFSVFSSMSSKILQVSQI